MAHLFPDFGPARDYPAFRRLLAGGLLSGLGGSMTSFAVTLQVWDLARSSFAVGAIGFTFIPVLFLGLLGGSIADAVDRRKLALTCIVALLVVSVLLAVQAYAGFGRLWLIYLLVVVQAMLQAISAPARQTFVPRLLPPERLRAGIALTTLSGRIVMLAGPALAGVIAGAWGLKTCYAIDVLSFGAALYAIFRLPVMRPDASRQAGRRSLHAIAEGLRYIRRTPVIAAAFLTDLDAMLLGLPVALFPALNVQHFGGRPQTLGLLTAAVGVGGLCTAALAGPASRLSRLGVGMLAGTMIWGAAIAAFALARSLPLALFFLAVAGAADTLTVTFRASMVQTLTPDELRGRVYSVEYIIGVGGGPLGNVEAGSLAALTSPAVSAFTGGGGCVAAAALIALAFPAFLRHRAHPAPAHRAHPAPAHRAPVRGAPPRPAATPPAAPAPPSAAPPSAAPPSAVRPSAAKIV